MGELAQRGQRRLWLEKLERPYHFVSPFGGSEFVVLILAEDRSITADEQMSVSQQLVSQGCRYALAMGIDASSWDTSIDLAYIQNDPRLEPAEDSFVMTTWHDDESPEEVAEWLIVNTAFDHFVPVNFLVLCLGSSEEQEDRLTSAAIHHFLSR